MASLLYHCPHCLNENSESAIAYKEWGEQQKLKHYIRPGTSPKLYTSSKLGKTTIKTTPNRSCGAVGTVRPPRLTRTNAVPMLNYHFKHSGLDPSNGNGSQSRAKPICKNICTSLALWCWGRLAFKHLQAQAKPI